MSLARRLSQALRVVVPMAMVATVVATAGPASAVPAYPYVHITSPGPTSSAAGTTAFAFSAALDPAGSDTIASFHLVVDGSSSGGSLGCPISGSKSCSAQLLWEAQAPNGTTATHSIQVEMDTTQNATVLSPAVSVTATHATATPVISSPQAGATLLTSDIFVEADASFAAPQYGDQMLAMSLDVNGTEVDYEGCEGSTAGSDCPVELYWDATFADTGDHMLQVRLWTSSGAVWSSDIRHITLAGLPHPVVTVTSPTADAAVSGLVTVVATGSVDGTFGDAPADMALFVDGHLVGNGQACPGSATTCTLSFPWDASGLRGKHTIEVGFETLQYPSVVFTAPTVVTVISPAPTVTVSLPGNPTRIVTGITQVTLTGTIDPSQTDSARDLQLYVNGEPWGLAQPCLAGGRTCTATISWDTSSFAGAQGLSLTGRFDTAHTSAWSAVGFVNVALDANAPGTRVVVLGLSQNGVDFAQVDVSDRFLNPIIGAAVSVSVHPAVGQSYTLTGVTTAPYGEVRLPLQRHVNSVLTASVSAASGSVSSNPRRFFVQAIASCRLPKSITHGRKIDIACKGSRVAAGTKVTLYFKYPHAGVHVLAHARFDAKGRAHLVFVSRVRKETVQLWALVANSAPYNGTQSLPILVRMI